MTKSLAVISKGFLALTLTSALAACGGGGSDDGGETTSPPPNKNPNPDTSTPVPGDNVGSGSESDDMPAVGETVAWKPASKLMGINGIAGDDGAVAVSESGDVAVAWIEKGQTNTVWARYYDKDSETWEQARQIGNGSSEAMTYISRSNPQVTFVGDVAVVAWDQGYTVYASTHDDNGWSGNAHPIEGADSDYQGFGVSLVPTPDDKGVLLTYELREEGKDSIVRSSEFSSVTGQWASPVTVGILGATPDYGIRMVVDEKSGSIHAVWPGAKDPDTKQSPITTASYAGGSWSDPEEVAASYPWSMVAHADPDGERPIIIWTRGRNGEVLYARFVKGAWSVGEVSSQGVRHKDITSTILAGGDVLIGYQRVAAGGGMKEIVTQQFDMSTGTWSDPVMHENFAVSRPSLAADGHGRAVLTYYQYNTWAANYTEQDGWSPVFQPNGLNSGRDNVVAMNSAGDTAIVYRNTNGEHGIRVLLGR